MKLLFVEDSPEIRYNYREFLSLYFTDIYETNCGKQALLLYKEYLPHVIIIDIHIDTLNGFEVIKQIRQSDKKTKVIILSAHKNETYLLDAIELNISKYLIKPIKRLDLKDILSKVKKEIQEENNIFLKGGFIWNIKDKYLLYKSKEIVLTKNEVKLLNAFCINPLNYFSLESAYYVIYDDLDNYNENKIKMIIKRFRKKTASEILINTYGLGYKFNLD